MPAASIVTRVTRARPIISDAAVDAVRCGLRIEFSRASSPAAPPTLSAGQPSTCAIGTMSCDEKNATPRKTNSAPTPIANRTGPVPWMTNRPSRTRANPSSPSAADAGVRHRARRPGGSVTPSRTAAIGGTRVALMAGLKLAITVTRMPTTSATTIVLDCSRRPAFGSVNPNLPNSQNRSLASPRPRKRPITDASTAITIDSISTARRIWRRDAPIVRSVANSRVRCAIVIESELAITKEPTKSAIPPKASRNVCRKSTNEVVSFAAWCAWSAPVRTCVAFGRMPRIWLSN